MGDTEVIVVKAPASAVSLGCGGPEMIPQTESRSSSAAPAPDLSEEILLGKRYADESVGIEVLCTKAGTGTLIVDGVVLARKDAKPLPASD